VDFHLTQVFDAVAAVAPERECIVWRDRRFTYADVVDRKRRLANHLLARGLGDHRDRANLQNWESGQHHLALYLHNGNEYLEGMLGAYAARLAPFNVNYRYVEEELVYLLEDSGARAMVFHSTFAPTLAKVLPRVSMLDVLLQVPDESGETLLDGAEWYEDALAASSPAAPDTEPDADDLYILYTGGTTGMPKGVLWRQGDIFPAALGGRDLASRAEFESLERIVEIAADGGARLMPAPPFMHGAAHWMAFNTFTGGNTIVIPATTTHLDPHDVWQTCADEKVNVLLIVGDAFARPLLDQLDTHTYDLSSLLMVVSGGAALSAGVKDALLERLPSIGIMDGLGASETGQQATQIIGSGGGATTGTFSPGPGMCIVDEAIERVLGPNEHDMGWLAQQGRVPLGYLGDRAKTEKTFPVIDDVRYSIPGDRARITEDGLLELHGRDSVTINSGGEKIFAEEVEAALKRHPSVYDVVVAGRPSERWGNEVVAVVQLRDGDAVTHEELVAEAERHIARYKLPKVTVFVPAVVRSPAGKADYRWARERAIEAG
jgi:fatty-acyl-CoA synthase